MRITREAKIGIFTTICLASLFWGVNFLKGKNIFNRTNTYHAIFTRIDGLKKTDNVLVSGYKVGTVKGIRFEEGYTGRLVVTLQVERRYPLPLNSIAKLVSADIMGGKAIKIEIAPNHDFHQSGDTLISSIETGLVDQMIHEMVPVKEKAEQLMVEMKRVMEVVILVFNHENRTNIDQSILSLKESIANLERTTASFDTMLNKDTGVLTEIFKNVRSISSNLEKNNQEITNIIQNFSTISDSLAKVDIASTLFQADSAINSFNQIVGKINRGEGSLGLLVNNDTLYNNLSKASYNLDLLLKDMKENPKRYVSFSIFGSKKN
jgi:phospholipid/cholesterol/gamma-HCH transport system substrate-binding protein